ncbi:MAG: uroporphyrinogen-III synthase [Actinomycetota bacterium]|nr:uroporphyrinogen-III synthase [Actinomycetota bacterium]
MPAFRVGITADRRWNEQARMFRSQGVEVLHGPTMRTIDLSADESLRASTVDLTRRPPDYLIVTTGMGMRKWLEAAAGWGLDGRLLAALSQGRVVARGAKATSAARGAGLDVWWRAPRETMQEIVDRLAEDDVRVAQARVALQVFDPEGHPATEALRAMAGELVELPVYHWALPVDPGPARALVEAAVTGRLDAVTFTAQPAVHHLFRIAGTMGLEGDLRAAFNDGLLASCVGPVCAAAAREEGVADPLWPDPARLGAMVRQVTARLVPGDPEL